MHPIEIDMKRLLNLYLEFSFKELFSLVGLFHLNNENFNSLFEIAIGTNRNSRVVVYLLNYFKSIPILFPKLLSRLAYLLRVLEVNDCPIFLWKESFKISSTHSVRRVKKKTNQVCLAEVENLKLVVFRHWERGLLYLFSSIFQINCH